MDGKFGWGEITEFGCTYGMNEKGVMNDNEFAKNVISNVVHLFPDRADADGYRVIFKCDGGPGAQVK